MRGALPHWSVLGSALAVALLASCAELKPAARTAHDIAKELCQLFYAERNGVSVEEAGRTLCSTERQLRPWLEEVLAAKQRAGVAATDGGAP